MVRISASKRTVLGVWGGGTGFVRLAKSVDGARQSGRWANPSVKVAAPNDSVIGGAGFAWIAKSIRAACRTANDAGGKTPRGDREGSKGKVELARRVGMSGLRMLTGCRKPSPCPGQKKREKRT